jgi:hypothetical protein
MINSRYKLQLSWIIPAAIGALTFLLAIGLKTLNVLNIAWLEFGEPWRPQDSDNATHYLGWLFFRHTPWEFPIVGSNPSYGLEISNSIIYSDSVPLFALFFKSIGNLLPEPFQYFGLWMLFCCILQAYFGFRLVALYSPSKLFQTLGCILFAFSPPMLARISPGHLSLLGHFFILASLLHILEPMRSNKNYNLKWLIILLGSALTHAYILAIVLILYTSDIVDRLLKRECRPKIALMGLLINCVLLVLCMYLSGYFTGGVSGESGFGIWHMNLLAPFAPTGWSRLLPEIPTKEGYFSDNNFLGLGVILLLVFVIFSPKKNIVRIKFFIKNHPIFSFSQIALLVFAISNYVGIGPYVFKYELPHSILQIANTFRISNRMFWSLFYLLILGSIINVLELKRYGYIAVLLTISALLQIIDTSGGWLAIHHRLEVKPSSIWSNDFKDPIWQIAAKKYKKLRWVMPVNEGPHWKDLAYFAGTHHLSTDAIYLARISQSALEQIQRDEGRSLRVGSWDADSIYVFEDSLSEIAAATIQPDDMLVRLNKLNVLFPGWKLCEDCIKSTQKTNFEVRKPLLPGDHILFNSANSDSFFYLLSGWHPLEAFGVWSNGPRAELIIPIQKGHKLNHIGLELTPLLASNENPNQIQFTINDKPVSNIYFNKDAMDIVSIKVPKEFQESSKLKLGILTSNSASPKSLGINGDARTLGVKLISLSLSE